MLEGSMRKYCASRTSNGRGDVCEAPKEDKTGAQQEVFNSWVDETLLKNIKEFIKFCELHCDLLRTLHTPASLQPALNRLSIESLPRMQRSPKRTCERMLPGGRASSLLCKQPHRLYSLPPPDFFASIPCRKIAVALESWPGAAPRRPDGRAAASGAAACKSP